MNKGQKRAIQNVRTGLTSGYHLVKQGLGISAKPVSEMTVKDYTDLISDIYFKQGAVEQIENTLNGKDDKKGPLSKIQKQMITQNPKLVELVRKICIEKALSAESIGMWNGMWEGVNPDGTNIVARTVEAEEFKKQRNLEVKKCIKGSRYSNEFFTNMNNTMNTSIQYSFKMIRMVNQGVELITGNDRFKSQTDKMIEAIDLPAIGLLERMNGSKEYIGQALMFAEAIKTGDLSKVISGPYTYRELARMCITESARDCIQDLNNLEQGRNDFENLFIMPQDDKMTEEEKGAVNSAKKNRESVIQNVNKAHKDSIKAGKIKSLKDYSAGIETLRESEKNANHELSRAVLNVRTASSKRDFEAKIEKDRKDALAIEEIHIEHVKAMEDIGKRAAAISAAQIQSIITELDAEIDGKNGNTSRPSEGRDEGR